MHGTQWSSEAMPTSSSAPAINARCTMGKKYLITTRSSSSTVREQGASHDGQWDSQSSGKQGMEVR